MRTVCFTVLILFSAFSGLCSSSTKDPEEKREPEPSASSGAVPAGSDESLGQTAEALARVCQFKEDHIVSDVEFSGTGIALSGSETEKRVEGIIEEKDFWKLGFLRDFSGKEFVLSDDGTLVLPYVYTGEEYSDWCSKEEEECVVEVIYKVSGGGAILQRQPKRHPRAGGMARKPYYVYTGRLTLQIVFSGKVLRFACPSFDGK